MAKGIGKANFVVIPTQFDTETEEVQGYAFTDNAAATTFATELQAFGKKLYGKLSGITPSSDATDEEKKDARKKLASVPQGVALDILIQPLDSDGDPSGDPLRMSSLRK
jgi:hypothetical protein